jgi:cell division protein ZapA
MPPRRAVELRVGGQTYRVVATDDDRHVQHLAELVDRKFLDVVPQGRGVTAQQAMFLTAPCRRCRRA